MNELLTTIQESKMWIAIFGFILIIIESYIPPIPLAGMVTWHGYALGPIYGLLLSLAASVIGSYLLYATARYFQKYIPDTLKNSKVQNWIHGRTMLTIALIYAVPFIPHIFLTVALGIVNYPIRKLLAALVVGKLMMFSFFTMLGYKYELFLKHPIYLVGVIAFILFVLMIAKKYFPTN